MSFIPNSPDIDTIIKGRVKMNAVNPTRIKFKGPSTPARMTGSKAGPFVITDGMTFIANVDASAEATTVTFAAAAGTEVGADSPATDITALTTPNFKIAVDGGTARSVTLATEGNDTGSKVAAAMQTAIRALGGVYAGVTVSFGTAYTITSGTKGTGSKVRITAGNANDCAAALKIGAANGATDTDGIGDFINAGAATVAEIVSKLGAALPCAVQTLNGAASLLSYRAGSLSSIVLGNGTANTALGFSNSQSVTGGQSIDAEREFIDETYHVNSQLEGNVSPVALSVCNKSTSGFDVYAATPAATDDLSVFVAGRALA